MSVKNLNAFSEGYTLTNWDLERLLPTETADLVVRPPLPWNRILDRVKETLLNNTTSRKRSYPRTHCIIASATRHGLHWYVALFNCQEMRARLVEPTASLEWSILLANELKAIGFEVAVSALSEQKENDNWRCGYVCLHVVRTICKAPKKWMQVEIPPLPQDSEASVWAALRRFELEERAEEEAKARAADRELRAKREERLRQHLHRQKEKKEKEAQVAEPTADAAGPEGAAAESGAQEGTVAPAEETDLPLLDEAAAAASPPRRSPTAFDGVSDALGTEDLAYNNPSSSTGGTPAPPPGSAAGGTPLPSPSPAKIGDGAPGRDLSDDAWLSVGSARQPGKAAQGAGDGDIFADLDGDLLMGGLEGEAAAGQAVAAAGAPPLKRKVPDEYDWLYDEDETKKAKREEAKDEVWLDSSHKKADQLRSKLAELRNRLASVEQKKTTIQQTKAYQRAVRRLSHSPGQSPASKPESVPCLMRLDSEASEGEATPSKLHLDSSLPVPESEPSVAEEAPSGAGSTPAQGVATAAAGEGEGAGAEQSKEAMKAKLKALLLKKQQLAAANKLPAK